MIAHRSSGAYFARMILLRLMRVLTLVAVLLAPLTMMASHAAAAAPMAHEMPMAHDVGDTGAMPGHCPPADDEQDKQEPTANIDCTIMCSAMPATDSVAAARLAIPELDLVHPVEIGGHGLNPAADPPPPRPS